MLRRQALEGLVLYVEEVAQGFLTTRFFILIHPAGGSFLPNRCK